MLRWEVWQGAMFRRDMFVLGVFQGRLLHIGVR